MSDEESSACGVQARVRKKEREAEKEQHGKKNRLSK